VQLLIGSPALPLGGIGGLHPKLHIMKKLGPAIGLSTVSTDQRYLEFSEYQSKEELK
jgi:hypothetical protein